MGGNLGLCRSLAPLLISKRMLSVFYAANQAGVNARLFQAGLAQVSLQHGCREGMKHRVEGEFKPGGEALRGVPVTIFLLTAVSWSTVPSRLLGAHPRQPKDVACRQIYPPQGSLSGWAPACRRFSQGLCFCRTEGSKYGISVFRLLPISVFCWCL